MNMYEICLLHARSDRVLRASIAARLGDSKVTMMEWLLLGVVSSGPAKGSSMSDIAGALHVTLPQVTALVNKLLPLKLIKQKSASVDRRSRLVSLTSKGELTFEEITQIIESAKVEFFEGLTDEAVEEYTQVLKKMSSL